MNRNKLTIIIKKPIKEVFEFTINPDNTHKWINTVAEEKIDDYPIKIGTIYRNRGKNDKEWSEYEVIKLRTNELVNVLLQILPKNTLRRRVEMMDGQRVPLRKALEIIDP